MDVTDDSDGRSNVYHITLLHEQLLGLCAYCLDDRLGQQFLLGKPRYAFIEVYTGCAVLVWVWRAR